MGIEGRALYQLAIKHKPVDPPKMGDEHVDWLRGKGYDVHKKGTEIYVGKNNSLSTDFRRLEMLYWIPIELIPTIPESWYWMSAEKEIMLYRLAH